MFGNFRYIHQWNVFNWFSQSWLCPHYTLNDIVTKVYIFIFCSSVEASSALKYWASLRFIELYWDLLNFMKLYDAPAHEFLLNGY